MAYPFLVTATLVVILVLLILAKIIAEERQHKQEMERLQAEQKHEIDRYVYDYDE
jgi:nucleoside permease NupC